MKFQGNDKTYMTQITVNQSLVFFGLFKAFHVVAKINQIGPGTVYIVEKV